MPLASYAQDYTYDTLHRLTTVTTTDRPVWSYHYDAAGNLLQVTANNTPPPPCLLYGVHDANRSDSQLFTVNPSQNFAVKLLGELHRHYDLEALDIHPLTHQLYVAAGADGLAAGSLYIVNSDTGELTWAGASQVASSLPTDFEGGGWWATVRRVAHPTCLTQVNL